MASTDEFERRTKELLHLRHGVKKHSTVSYSRRVSQKAIKRGVSCTTFTEQERNKRRPIFSFIRYFLLLVSYVFLFCFLFSYCYSFLLRFVIFQLSGVPPYSRAGRKVTGMKIITFNGKTEKCRAKLRFMNRSLGFGKYTYQQTN